MKLYMTLFSYFFYSLIYSQDKIGIFPAEDGMITYSEVVNVDSIKCSTLKTNAKLFANKLANTYNSNVRLEANKLKDFIIQDDATSLISNIRFEIKQGISTVYCEGLLSFYFKEGKYKYILNNVRIFGNSLTGTFAAFPIEKEKTTGKASKFATKADATIKDIIAQIKYSMTKRDNW